MDGLPPLPQNTIVILSDEIYEHLVYETNHIASPRCRHVERTVMTG
jgi:aspartate/methionine/tyrosine aminotransferase